MDTMALILIVGIILFVCPITAIYNIVKSERLSNENRKLRNEIKRLKEEHNKKYETIRKALQESFGREYNLKQSLKKKQEEKYKHTTEETKEEESAENSQMKESLSHDHKVIEKNPLLLAWLENKKYELCEKIYVGNGFRIKKEEYPEEIEKDIQDFFESQSEVVAVSVDDEGIYVFCNSTE